MEIQIEHNGIKISGTGIPERTTKENLMNIAGSIYEMIQMVSTNSANKSVEIPYKAPEVIKRTVEKKESSSPLIRPRIPNNVVDISELDIKQAVTEEALVRCPGCGQSHVLAVNSGNRIYVMRKFYAISASDEFRIVAEFDSLTSQDFIGMCCKPETNRKAYFEDIQKLKMLDDKDFAVDNNTEIFCPVCCKSYPFNEWKDAYENPLKYFETEHLCDACGGEKFEKVIKGGKKYECDSCGLTGYYNKDKKNE